jgi:hypothetical protein
MAKGFFTQGLVVLLRQPMSRDDLEGLLSSFRIVEKVEAASQWEFGGPSIMIAYRPEVNGYVPIDVVDRTWPDHMGDPQKEPTLFGAWSMGYFGPYTFPWGLQRATQQSWRWSAASEVVDFHHAFLRIRLSYIFGARKDAPVMPRDCDPLAELQFLTNVALATLRHAHALCYFNPNGEVLRDSESLQETISRCAEHGLPALEAWANIRLYQLDSGWSLMDSVGNWQLDIPDQEVAFPTSRFSPQEVDRFIRNISLYILQNGQIIKDGDTTDGPGSIRWQARSFENGLSDPPRTVLRWLPMGIRAMPPKLLGEQPKKEPESKKPWWKIW